MKVNKIVFFNSLIYAFLIQNGLLGFNYNFEVYIQSPNNAWRRYEFIAGYISTLTINDLFVAPFFASLILALGLGNFLTKLNEVFKKSNKDYSFHAIIFIHILLLLSWPIFLGATTAFRQGVTLGLCFFLLSFLLDEKKNLWLLLLISFLLFFSHKFGKFNIFIIYISYFLNYSFFKFNISNRVTVLFSLVNIFICYFIIDFFNLAYHSDNYVTGYDLLYFFYLIFSFLFIIIFLFKIKNYKIRFLLLFFANMFVLSSLIFFNNSILYERINWLTFIISIFLISFYFSHFLKININLITIAILLLLVALTLKFHLPENLMYYEKFKRDGLIK
jgi:hypothetical protein